MQEPQDNPFATSGDGARPPAGWERETLEQLAFASLREQQTARRWKNGLRLAWLLFAVLVFWLGWNYNTPAANPSMPHTAMVAIKGEIASKAMPAPKTSWRPCARPWKTAVLARWCC